LCSISLFSCLSPQNLQKPPAFTRSPTTSTHSPRASTRSPTTNTRSPRSSTRSPTTNTRFPRASTRSTTSSTRVNMRGESVNAHVLRIFVRPERVFAGVPRVDGPVPQIEAVVPPVYARAEPVNARGQRVFARPERVNAGNFAVRGKCLKRTGAGLLPARSTATPIRPAKTNLFQIHDSFRNRFIAEGRADEINPSADGGVRLPDGFVVVSRCVGGDKPLPYGDFIDHSAGYIEYL